jgi:hypothetical protein
MKKPMVFAAMAIAVAVTLIACGGKKKDEGAKMPAPDGKTSATASYDSSSQAQKQ